MAATETQIGKGNPERFLGSSKSFAGLFRDLGLNKEFLLLINNDERSC